MRAESFDTRDAFIVQESAYKPSLLNTLLITRDSGKESLTLFSNVWLESTAVMAPCVVMET